jgi:hypothetical protein
MADQTAPAPTICPWCSATLPADPGATCPSCGATLRTETEAQVPGVTAIDAEAIVRAARAPTPQRRSRLLSWISGDYEDEGGEAASTPESLAPPPPEVRREILRLELEAEVANLQAEAESIMADAEVEAHAEGAEGEPGSETGSDLAAAEPPTDEPPTEAR